MPNPPKHDARTPASPTVSVPSSAYTGYRFQVTTSNTCIAGTSPNWDVWTSGSGTHWPLGSFSDYWSSAGVRTYYGQVWCSGPDVSGARSGIGQDSISIVNPPAPRSSGGPLTARVVVVNGTSTRVSTFPDDLYADSYRWEVENWPDLVPSCMRTDSPGPARSGSLAVSNSMPGGRRFGGPVSKVGTLAKSENAIGRLHIQRLRCRRRILLPSSNRCSSCWS